MPDIELLGILMITCELVGDQQADRKFDCQTALPSNGSSSKANTGQWLKTDNTDVVNASSTMPDSFRSRNNRTADKRASQALMQKIHSEFSDILQELAALKACLAYSWRQLTIPDTLQVNSIYTPRTPQGGAWQTTKATHNSVSGCGWGIRVVQQLCPSSQG